MIKVEIPSLFNFPPFILGLHLLYTLHQNNFNFFSIKILISNKSSLFRLRQSSSLANLEIPTKTPLFSDWYFTKFNFNHLCSNRQQFYPANETSIIKYYVCYPCSNMCSNQFVSYPYKIHFWQDPEVPMFATKENLINLIKKNFSSLVVNPNTIVPMISMNIYDTMQAFQMVKKRQTIQRIIFHYIDYESEIKDKGSMMFSDGNVEFRKFLEAAGETTGFIFDRDDAGSLFKSVVSYINERETKPDLVAFFSCSEGETMPRYNDYPIDLFSSCLNSPAKTALLWHSKHYFCFNCGLLQPLNTFFFENIDDLEEKKRVEEILEQIKIVLRATVESIAFELMEPSLFVKLFRTDKTISELCINFVLAVRILNQFHVHPLSYPVLPDFNSHKNWHVFDLRLDAALFLLENKSTAHKLYFHDFLSQTLNSLEHSVELGLTENTIPYELALFQEILLDKELCEEACKILAKYLDSSTVAIDYCLYLNIPKALFRLSGKIINGPLLFCCIKFLSYSKETRSILFLNEFNRIVEEVIIPILKSQYSKLAIIFLAILLDESINPIRKILTNYDIFRSYDLLSLSGDSLIWSLQIFGCILPNILDLNINRTILNQMIEISKTATPEIQISLINGLSGFIRCSSMIRTNNNIKEKKNIEKQAVKTALQFAHSASFVTRRELYLLIHKYEVTHQQQINEKQDEFHKSIREFLEQCKNDSSLIVRDAYEEGKDNSIIQSHILEFYTSIFLKPVYPLLSDPSKNLSSFFQQTKPIVTMRKIIKPHNVKVEQKTLKLGTGFHHTTTITSNLINLPDEQILFGDSEGSIFTKLWDSTKIFKQSKITNSSITDVQYFKNSGYPLVFAVDQAGDCFCFNYDETNSFNQITTFNIVKTTHPSHIHHCINEEKTILYSYAYSEGDEFYLHELTLDRPLPSIKPKSGHTISLQPLHSQPDCISLCGSGFEYYDLRISRTEPVVHDNQLISNAYYHHVIDDKIPIFAIATETSNVCLLDLRHPEGIRTTTPYFGMDQTNQQTMGFASQKLAQTAAVSHNYGVTCLNLVTGRQESLPLYARNKPIHANALLFHERKFELSFVQDDYIGIAL